MRVAERAALGSMGNTRAALLLAPATALLLSASVFAQPVTSHPRLWVTSADLPRLRSWASPVNPIFSDGLKPLAEVAKAEMDTGRVPGSDTRNGGSTYVDYPAEMYAELFAFMSLVSPVEADRNDYAQRARTLLMYVINKAAPGAADGQPYRDPQFAINDRSRWHGEGFALTTDWIYAVLTDADKAAIRKVFLRWIGENLNAAVTAHDHPVPPGVINDPVLIADPVQLRWSLNNYFTAHMRNIGQMSLAFDAADDPDGSLRGYLTNATGAWLYIVDRALRTIGQGGFGPEGFEYFPQTVGYAAQFLLSLRTAGRDDPLVYGPQVRVTGNPFWDELVNATLHSVSPGPTTSASLSVPVYLPAWFGDGQNYWAPDTIAVFGPLGVLDAAAGTASRLAALRWIERNVPAGGPAGLARRAFDTSEFFQNAVLYFLLFDPTAVTASDPRPSRPLDLYAPGLGRILSRTSWGADASWLTYKLSFNSVDHQYGDGNQLELFRKGEWLTKERTGYDLDYGGPQNHNTLALENDRPEHDDPCAFRGINWAQGAQWAYVSSGDPALLAQSFGTDYAYALGDATNLYNSSSEGSTNVLEASRSIVWLKPDHVVVYDRAATKTSGRFKRFWLSLPGPVSVSSNRSTMTAPSGQKLFVTTLLPSDASIATEAATVSRACGSDSGFVAQDDPIRYRLKVEAPGGPAKTRFLNVLQGADAGASPDVVTLIQSTAGTPYAGALVKGNAVLFPVDRDVPFTSVTYTVPSGSGPLTHRITGLAPNGAYAVSTRATGAGTEVTVSSSGSPNATADPGGLLRISDSGTGGGATATLVVPIVLTSSGLSGAFFTTELALTNRGSTDASLSFRYTQAFGGGDGTATDTLGAGRQKVVPDGIEYLRSIGLPIPATGNRGGTLRVTFTGLSAASAAAVTARTTTAVPEGRAGLAYAGVRASAALTGPAWIHGLRQNATDRSNVALLNAGGPGEGSVTLRVTVFSGDTSPPAPQALPGVTLPPGGFFQLTQVLVSNGLDLSNGYVKVERVAGSAAYFAYGVVNDQINSDGSFVPPVPDGAFAGRTGLTLPVLVEAGSFTSELVASESAGNARTLNCRLVASGIQTPDHTARFSLALKAGEQRIIPDVVQYLRGLGVVGIGPPGTVSGALFVTPETGDAGGLFIGARTSAPGGGGRYGVFYSATPYGGAASGPVWLYGLRQDDENRANLALVNTGETDSSRDIFRIEIFDGDTGKLAAAVDGISLEPYFWTQIGTVLATYAPGVSNAYARVTRTSGNNPFLAYAVVNDGAGPGQRSGDGAFVPAQED